MPVTICAQHCLPAIYKDITVTTINNNKNKQLTFLQFYQNNNTITHRKLFSFMHYGITTILHLSVQPHYKTFNTTYM